ncbi:hypothetical protein [Roseateles chitinivorans]|uniref:hypothetical protein n=1 Tax=Roseateles chitinivorans TaxID=2917965 RepID=UPI003D66A6C2
MPGYNDIFMRDFVGDTGQIPSTTRVAVSCSPDIIPAGTTQIPNYMTALVNNYNGAFNYFQNIQQNLYNYIYVRGYNLRAGAETGTIALYYAPSSLLLTPASWINNRISNFNGTQVANLSANATNQVVVGDAPFYWQPPPLAPNMGHYCLVAQVVTPNNPNAIPSSGSLEDFAVWVANHPGIAWRNVTVVTSMPSSSYTGFQGIQNPQGSAVLSTLTVRCVNVPDNTNVQLVCPVSGPQPAIAVNGAVGPGNRIQDPKFPNDEINIFAAVSLLPANFQAQVQLTLNVPQGQTLPNDASVTVSYFLNSNTSSKAAHVGIAPEVVGLTSADIGAAAGNGIMLLLGDYTYEFDLH